LDVLLLTDAHNFDRALPPLASFARIMGRAPLTGEGDSLADPGDVAIVDARRDPALIEPTDEVTVDGDWNVDDVVAPGTDADELHERLRWAIVQRRSAVDGSLRFGALLLHPTSLTGSLEGKDLGLTLTEFRLLSFLV